MTATANARPALRSALRVRRGSLDPESRAGADAAAQAHLLEFDRVRTARIVGLYRAFDGEVATDQIARVLGEAGALVVYARVRERDAPLAFVHPDRWTRGAAGQPEPEGDEVPLAAVELLVVPGLGFDDRGHRLGFGAGFYDRTLAACSAWPVGLAYECQRLPRLEVAAWDQPVAALATERQLYTFDRETETAWST